MAGTLQNIRYFVAAYEEGSFTKAAVRENATQPGVSHHIRKLEAVLGAELFNRRNSIVEATPAGHVFYKHCLKVIEAHDAAIGSIRPFAGVPCKQITVGLVPTLTRRAITPAVKGFMASNPTIGVKIIEGPCNEIVAMAAREELDLAISQQIATDSGLTTTLLADSPNFVVSRRTPEGGNLTQFTPNARQPLKLLWPSASNPHRQMVEKFVDASHLNIVSNIEVLSIQMMLDFVNTSDWQTILPQIMFDQYDLAHFNLEPVKSTCVQPLVLYQPAKKSIPTAAKDLVDHIVRSVDNILEEWERLIDEANPPLSQDEAFITGCSHAAAASGVSA